MQQRLVWSALSVALSLNLAFSGNQPPDWFYFCLVVGGMFGDCHAADTLTISLDV